MQAEDRMLKNLRLSQTSKAEIFNILAVTFPRLGFLLLN